MGNLELQCAACGNLLEAESDTCPNCGAQIVLESATIESTFPDAVTTNGARVSTLLEFPGVASRPQWRKDLSERVREIQKKRALEAAQEAEEATHNATPHAPPIPNNALGLVPPAEPQPLNPLVEKALKRLERARQAPPPAPPSMPRIIRGGRTAAATAQALVLEPQTARPVANTDAHARLEQSPTPLITSHPEEPKTPRVILQAVAETASAETINESRTFITDEAAAQATPRNDAESHQTTLAVDLETTASTPTSPIVTSSVNTPTTSTDTPTPAMNLDVIAQTEATMCEENATPKQTPRRVCVGVIDDAYLARREAETLARYQVEQRDERASLFSRFAASIFDWLLVTVISASIVFLLYPSKMNLHDIRLLEIAGGIAIALAILYSTFALTLAGRTFGMKLLGLNVVNARDGFTPSFFRSLLRAFSYLFALAVCGFGILYTLIDDERRGLHDHFAGTIVVKTVIGDK